jgi:hypothetical protein
MHAQRERTWWQRNLKWVITTGVLAVLLCMAIFVGGIIYVVGGAMRSSEVYQTALARARVHPQVIERLGEPLEPGWFFSGSLNVTPRSGDADIGISLSGPKGEATIGVVAFKKAGVWYYDIMRLESAGAAPIDLRTAEDIAAVDAQR